MKRIEAICLSLIIIALITMVACTTDPVIPASGIPLDPPVEDPGDLNPCADGVISFQHQVLPIMISSCAYSGCHDVITAEDDVILVDYETVRKEVTPGDPNNSELYESIIETDPDDVMPPPPAPLLTEVQIQIIKDWINQGANNTDCGVPCDSTATSFAADIFPLMQSYCVGCHYAGRTDGGVNLESYNEIIPYVDNGSLIGSMKHDPLYAVMPPSGSKLSSCRIAQVQKWIEEGAQNN